MDEPAVRVLLVEDNPGDVRLIREALKDARGARFTLDSAGTMAAALERLAIGKFDVVLLDLSLPDSDGLDTFRSLHAGQPQVPVLILSGNDDETVATDAVNEGAQDFIVKGRVDADLLGRAIRYAIERHRMLEQVRQLAILDSLTGLANRRGFTMLCEHHLEVAKRHQKPLTLLFLDIDRMKAINDQFGHAAGDQALIDMARLMEMTFRRSDILARLGGDEFSTLLTETPDEGADVAVGRLQDKIEAFNAEKSRPYTLAASVGVARYDPEAPSSLESLISVADAAMYRQKGARRHAA